MRLRLQRNSRSLERNKVLLLAARVTENDSAELDPGVGFKVVRFFSRPDSQHRIHPATPEHPAQYQRLFETCRANEKTASRRGVKSRNLLRALDGGRNARIGVYSSDTARERSPTNAKPCEAPC